MVNFVLILVLLLVVGIRCFILCGVCVAIHHERKFGLLLEVTRLFQLALWLLFDYITSINFRARVTFQRLLDLIGRRIMTLNIVVLEFYTSGGT